MNNKRKYKIGIMVEIVDQMRNNRKNHWIGRWTKDRKIYVQYKKIGKVIRTIILLRTIIKTVIPEVTKNVLYDYQFLRFIKFTGANVVFSCKNNILFSPSQWLTTYKLPKRRVYTWTSP